MSERLLRKENMIDKTKMWIVGQKYPNASNLSKEELVDLCNSEDITREAIFNLNFIDLQNRLFEEYHENKSIWDCREQANKWLTMIPKELMPNIEEWLDCKPLSDIEIYGFSINYILNRYKHKNIDFIDAVEAFIIWKRTNYCDKGFFNVYFSRGY